MSGFAPTHVGELELAAGIEGLETPPSPDGLRYAASRALVRLHGVPLGFVTIPLVDGRADAAAQLAVVQRELGHAIEAHLEADGLPAGPAPDDPPCGRAGAFGNAAEPLTVVVCTKDSGPSLATTLRTLLDQDLQPAEVLVVDNASRSDAARRMVDGAGSPLLRRVEEPIAGLSRARNRGLVEASTQLVAFTDDDVRLDRGWVRGMTRGFTRGPRVGCVTGIVATAELETPAQAFFDARVHWAEGMHPRLFDLGANRPDDPFFPYAAGTFGTGASMALDRRAVAAIGLFDEALGMGTPAENGEDLDMFLRVIAGGWTLAYEPAAVAWHSHRRDSAQLRRQMYTYGVGLSAYAFKHACRPRTGADMARRAPAALLRLARDALAAERVATGTRGIAGVELRGLFGGPAGYLRGRRRLRGRDAVTPTIP